VQLTMIWKLGHPRNLNSCFCSRYHIDYGVYYFYLLYKFWFDRRKRETRKWKKCQAKYRVFDLPSAGGNITFDLQYILSLKWMNGSFNMAIGIVMQDLIKSEMWRLLLWVYYTFVFTCGVEKILWYVQELFDLQPLIFRFNVLFLYCIVLYCSFGSFSFPCLGAVFVLVFG